MNNLQDPKTASSQDFPHQSNSPEENSLNEITKQILMNHLQSFQDNNLDAVLSDYTSISVFITKDQTYVGPTEIRTFFKDLIGHFPKEKSSFELNKMVIMGELAFIVWNAETPTLNVPLGTDTFIIKKGKIHQQTFAGQLKFI
jgi:hypothetical protein